MVGYYRVTWNDFADTALLERRPGPLIGEWELGTPVAN
jgi:hypothetical protein